MDAADFEIIQLLGVATEIEVLQIIGAAVMPSIIGLLLAFVAFWLPDDDSQQQQFVQQPRHISTLPIASFERLP
jgi:hypothetical protein